MITPFEQANFNLTQFAKAHIDLWDSTPKTISLQQKNENGEIETVEIKNRGEFLAEFERVKQSLEDWKTDFLQQSRKLNTFVSSKTVRHWVKFLELNFYEGNSYSYFESFVKGNIAGSGSNNYTNFLATIRLKQQSLTKKVAGNIITKETSTRIGYVKEDNNVSFFIELQPYDSGKIEFDSKFFNSFNVQIKSEDFRDEPDGIVYLD